MKRAFFILLLTTFYSCSQDEGPCGGGGGCGPISRELERKNLGSFPLSDSSRIWLQNDTVDEIAYINNAGYITRFSLVSKTAGNLKQPFIYTDTVIKELCCTYTQLYYDYVATGYEKTSYRSIDLPFSYSVGRSSFVTSSAATFESTGKFSGVDVLAITFNSLTLPLPFNRTIPTFTTYFDSIQLNGKTYREVYKVTNDPSKVDPAVVKPFGAYYSVSMGMLGFFLTNGETWIRQ